MGDASLAWSFHKEQTAGKQLRLCVFAQRARKTILRSGAGAIAESGLRTAATVRASSRRRAPQCAALFCFDGMLSAVVPFAHVSAFPRSHVPTSRPGGWIHEPRYLEKWTDVGLHSYEGLNLRLQSCTSDRLRGAVSITAAAQARSMVDGAGSGTFATCSEPAPKFASMTSRSS